jgi:serine protease
MKSTPRSERDLCVRTNRLAAAVTIALVVIAALGVGLMRSTDASAAGTAVVATAPSFSDDVCSNFLPTGATYTIPSTVGVDYVANGAPALAGIYNAADGATVTVTAQAQAGFVLTGTTTFAHTFSATPNCTTHVTPVAPSFADDICTAGGSTGASYTVPATVGVDYLVNGVKAAAGTFPTTDGTKVTIQARAQAGYSLSGSSSFTHTFAATCLTSVSPTPPVFADDVCAGPAAAGATYLIPTTTGVDYLANGVKAAAGTYPATDGSTVTVTTLAEAGFALGGSTSFTHTFAAAPTCNVAVTVAAPSFSDGACSAGAPSQAIYTIPASVGVDYFVAGVKTAAGAYNGTGGATITITALPKAGYTLTGPTTFTHVFAATPTCTTSGCSSRAPDGHDRGKRCRLCKGRFSAHFRIRREHFRTRSRHDSHRPRRR